jgi:hypothetical protein
MWLMYVSWPRSPAPSRSIITERTEEDKHDATLATPDNYPPQYDELIRFFVKYVAPVVRAHRRLQEEILSIGICSAPARELAIQGLSNDTLYRSFMLAEAPMSGSPASRPSFADLTTSIHNTEFNYQHAVADRDALAHSLGLQAHSDKRLLSLWNDWKATRNALVNKYEDIKTDQRFGILFRPFRESKWGDIIL